MSLCKACQPSATHSNIHVTLFCLQTDPFLHVGNPDRGTWRPSAVIKVHSVHQRSLEAPALHEGNGPAVVQADKTHHQNFRDVSPGGHFQRGYATRFLSAGM